MSSAVGFAVGVALGVCLTSRLRHQTTALLRSPRTTVGYLTLFYIIRLITAGAVLSALLMWSTVAVLGGLAGYWVARTVYLAMAVRA